MIKGKCLKFAENRKIRKVKSKKHIHIKFIALKCITKVDLRQSGIEQSLKSFTGS